MTPQQEKKLDDLIAELQRVKWATAFALGAWYIVIFEINSLFMQ